MDQVRKHFERHARRGITLSARQLAEYCRKRNLPFTLERLRKIRHEFKFTAFYSRYAKPLRYMSSSVPKYGVVMADMANFMPQHRRANDGAVAFLCVVECLSGQLAAVPCKDLTSKSWERALVSVAEGGSAIHAVRVVVSDRDSAVKSNHASAGLRARLKARYDVGWIFLKNRNKAYKVRAQPPPSAPATPLLSSRLSLSPAQAERMIRFLKQRLSIAERASGDGRWAAHLPGILREYNGSRVKGTDVRRADVTQDNYLELLGKLRRTTEPSMLFNMTESLRAPSALSRYLWRYAVGDRVLLARRVDYDLRDRTYFEKPSVTGAYGPRVLTVTACRTKLNADFFLCPVYALSSASGPMTGLFYESELSPALFDGAGGRAARGVTTQQRRGDASRRPAPPPPPPPVATRRQRRRR